MVDIDSIARSGKDRRGGLSGKPISPLLTSLGHKRTIRLDHVTSNVNQQGYACLIRKDSSADCLSPIGGVSGRSATAEVNYDPFGGS